MIEAGQLWPVIARTHPLEHTVDALCLFASGHVSGKVVLAV